MKWSLRSICHLLCGVALCLPATTTADTLSSWRQTTAIGAAFGSYSESDQRDNMREYSVTIHNDYLDDGGFTLGWIRSTVDFKPSINDIKQTTLFVSGRNYHDFDGAPGKLGLRLDLHYINNDDATGNSDKVKVYSPRVSWSNYSKSLYLDIGYTRSEYQNDLSVDQWSPTIGVGWNDGSDWLQLRGFITDNSNIARSQNLNGTEAIEAKWSHWFSPGNLLRLHKLELGGVSGERLYAVDPDSGSVYNLSDLQEGRIALGAEWRLGDNSRLLLTASEERYHNLSIDDRYKSRVASATFTTEW